MQTAQQSGDGQRAIDPGDSADAVLPAGRSGRARRTVAWLPHRLIYRWAPKVASALRKRWAILKNLHADVRFEGSCYLGPGFSLHIPGPGTFVAGAGCQFRRAFRAEVSRGGTLRIGAGSVFTDHVLVQCSTTIEIGERCMFGQSNAVFDGNHRFRELDRPMLEQGYDFRSIRIEDDATVTTKCTILNDLGTRCFVGANSVVSRPVPAYCLAAGAPARPLEYYGPPGGEPPELAGPSAGRS